MSTIGRLRDATTDLPDQTKVMISVRVNGIDYIGWVDEISIINDPAGATRITGEPWQSVMLISKSGAV